MFQNSLIHLPSLFAAVPPFLPSPEKRHISPRSTSTRPSAQPYAPAYETVVLRRREGTLTILSSDCIPSESCARSLSLGPFYTSTELLFLRRHGKPFPCSIVLLQSRWYHVVSCLAFTRAPLLHFFFRLTNSFADLSQGPLVHYAWYRRVLRQISLHDGSVRARV